jgi:hypothetical protein
MNLKINSFIFLGTLIVAGVSVGVGVGQSSDAITLEEYNQTQVDPSFLDDDVFFTEQPESVDDSTVDVEDEPFNDSDVVDPSDSDFSFVDDEVVPDKSNLEDEQVLYPVAPLTPEEEAQAEQSWLELSTNFALKNDGRTWATLSPDGLTKCVEAYDSWICRTKGEPWVRQMQADFIPDYLLPEVPSEAILALAKVHPLGQVESKEITMIDDQWCLVGYNTKIIQAYDPADGSVKAYPLESVDGRLALTLVRTMSR